MWPTCWSTAPQCSTLGTAEIAAIARAWGLVDVTGLVEMPQTGLTVDLARHVLIAPGIEARFDGRAG